jgi:hypothetical protein
MEKAQEAERKAQMTAMRRSWEATQGARLLKAAISTMPEKTSQGQLHTLPKPFYHY